MQHFCHWPRRSSHPVDLELRPNVEAVDKDQFLLKMRRAVEVGSSSLSEVPRGRRGVADSFGRSVVRSSVRFRSLKRVRRG